MINYAFLKYWYIFLTFIVIVSPLEIGIMPFLIGLIIMWFLLYIYKLGLFYKEDKKNKNISTVKLKEDNFKSKYIALTVSITYFVFIIQYVQYYTGHNFIDVWNSFANSTSNYRDYQIYFEENNIGALTLAKIPWIIFFGLLKFITYYYTLEITSYQSKISKINWLTLLIFVLTFFYSAIGRGTSFEIFEMIIFSIFIFLLKSKVTKQKQLLSNRSKLLIFFIGLAGGLYFINNISKRFGLDSLLESDFQYINCANSNFCMDKKSIMFQISPVISLLFLQLSGYFTFGIFYISEFFQSIIFNNFQNLLILIIPFGPKIFMNDTYQDIMCKRIIDCGLNWIPDLNLLLNNLGLILTIILIFFLGRIAKNAEKGALKGNVFSAVLLYFITLFVFSLPSGNFVSTSSSSQICIVFSLLSVVLSKYLGNKKDDE